jgi:hypothetical protein
VRRPLPSTSPAPSANGRHDLHDRTPLSTADGGERPEERAAGAIATAWRRACASIGRRRTRPGEAAVMRYLATQRATGRWTPATPKRPSPWLSIHRGTWGQPAAPGAGRSGARHGLKPVLRRVGRERTGRWKVLRRVKLAFVRDVLATLFLARLDLRGRTTRRGFEQSSAPVSSQGKPAGAPSGANTIAACVHLRTALKAIRAKLDEKDVEGAGGPKATVSIVDKWPRPASSTATPPAATSRAWPRTSNAFFEWVRPGAGVGPLSPPRPA